jgi:hypothetical protein
LEDEVVAKRGEDALASQLIPTDRKLWEMAKNILYIISKFPVPLILSIQTKKRQ